jgi:hypothetical protein
MNDLGAVQVVKATQNVIHYGFNLGFLQMLRRFQKLFQIHITLIQNKVHVIKVLRIL